MLLDKFADDTVTVSDVKNSCEEFSTLTYDQLMRIAELIVELKTSLNEGTVEDLRYEISELEDKVDDLETDVDFYSMKYREAERENEQLKAELAGLKK